MTSFPAGGDTRDISGETNKKTNKNTNQKQKHKNIQKVNKIFQTNKKPEKHHINNTLNSQRDECKNYTLKCIGSRVKFFCCN